MKKSAAFLLILLLLVSAVQAYDSTSSPDFDLRRQNLRVRMGEGIAMLSSQIKSRDQMRDNKAFYYLTGTTDRNAILVMIEGGEPQTYLFSAGGNWTGTAPQGEIQCRPMTQLLSTLRTHMGIMSPIYLSFSDLDLLNRAGGGMNPFSSAKSMSNLDPLIEDMRVIKSDYELECLKQAIHITAEGLNETMRAVTPGMKEYDLAAILEYSFHRQGSPGSTFLQAASGPNSTFVHFGAGDRVLQEGDMIVFDVGAEYLHYTADISRSIPAGGRFTPEQKDIYSLVLEAQKAAIDAMNPGLKFIDSHRKAEDILMQGLYALGLVTDPESPWQKRLFIQHGFYHFIGLDIHDIWYTYRIGLEEKHFAKGMIITMEPGLYFPSGMLDSMPRRLSRMVSKEEFEQFVQKIQPVYEKYTDIGVRIEDDVLITEQGHEIVSAGVPKEIKEIEALMKEKSPHNLIKH